MGKKMFVKELKGADNALIFTDIFLVTSKSVLRTNAGKPYLNITLKDATGEIEGRVWDRVNEISDRFGSLDYVTVTGSVVNHQGRFQVKIIDMDRADEEEVVPSDYLPSSRKPVGQMWKELEDLVSSIEDPGMRQFLERIFSHEEVELHLKAAPAGKKLHHNWVGGLLEHILSVAVISDFLSSHYHEVDRDMLISGALLHDIGKIYELSYDRGFDYTDGGKLIGHIVIGSDLVSRVARETNLLTEEKEMLLKHIILSHHGELEYGSPKRPKTLEALIIHFVENMDSKVNAFLSALESSDGGSHWSEYQRMFSRFLYMKRD